MQATTNVSVKSLGTKMMRKHSKGSKTNAESMKIPEELADLINDDEKSTNYVGGIIAAVVIIFLLGMIGLSTYLTMQNLDNKNKLVPFAFSDIFKILVMEENHEFLWKESNFVFRNESGNFYTIHTSKNYFSNITILLSKKFFRKGMKVSNDLTTWVFPAEKMNDVNKYQLMYFVNDLDHYRNVEINSSSENYFSTITWGPKQKYMVAVYNENIYFTKNPLKENSFVCLSCNLNQKKSYGQFIGYYEKKIFKSKNAFWWSDDARLIAFMSMSEEIDKLTTTETYTFQSLYSEFRNISYSKAGKSPSLYNCQIYAVNLDSLKQYHIELSSFVPFKPYFIINVKWFNSSSILISILSHDQRQSGILFCLLFEKNCFVVYGQKFSTGWIDMGEYQDIITLKEQGAFIMAVIASDSQNSKRNLVLIKINKSSKNIVRWLTAGTDFVLKLYRVDEFDKNIFYLSRSRNSSIQHLYRTNIESLQTSCVSCQITLCNKNKISFSQMSFTFFHECLDFNFKRYQIIQIKPDENKILLSTYLNWKSGIFQYLKNKSLPRVEYLPIQLENNHYKYEVLSKIYHPLHLNPKHVIKYPVLLILPDDPFNTDITNDFQIEWIQYLVSFLHFVVIQLEVRGSGHHYFKYHTSLAKSLGSNDMEDIVRSMKFIFDQRKYLDNSSVAVVGQKYGGYLSLKLAYDNYDNFPNFKCGVSINPIFDFSFYDSFFAERYFQIYKTENIYYHKAKLKFLTQQSVKELLLIHDMNQNDVLFESTAKLIKELVKNDIQFDYLPLYGYNFEGIRWNNDKYVLKKITTFVTNCFNRSSLIHSLLSNTELHSY